MMITEADRFSTTQARLLQETGTRVNSRWLTIRAPAALVQQVHVLEGGRDGAPPVVLIHGGNSVAASWVPLLGLLQDNFRLYAPDRPGCGLTDRVDYRGVSVREHAVAFITEVLDGLGLSRASLVGNSMGGYWALLFALAHPERVERLALVGEPAGSAHHPGLRHRFLSWPGINRLLYATALKPNRQRTRGQMKMLVAHPERVTEAYLDMVYAAATLPGAQRAWLSIIEQVWPVGKGPTVTYALRPELPHLSCKTCFIWGTHDFCSPIWGQQLCQLVPGASFELISDAGHLAWLDAPQQVADLLHEFLGAAQPGSPLVFGEHTRLRQGTSV